MRNRYWALNLIAGINVFVGGVLVIIAVLVGFIVLVTALGPTEVPPMMRAASVAMSLYGLAIGVSLVASGEMIRLAIDVADATRRLASDVRALRDRDVQELR